MVSFITSENLLDWVQCVKIKQTPNSAGFPKLAYQFNSWNFLEFAVKFNSWDFFDALHEPKLPNPPPEVRNSLEMGFNLLGDILITESRFDTIFRKKIGSWLQARRKPPPAHLMKNIGKKKEAGIFRVVRLQGTQKPLKPASWELW